MKEACMVNKERMLNTFMEYVRIDSETKNEKAIGERIIKNLKDLGLKTHTDGSGKKLNSNGNNIYCFIPGTSDSESMLFSAHMDTVVPGVGIEPYIDGEYVKSRGNTILGGDDKAGVVAILEAVRTLKESNLPHRPIEIVFSICEEGGINGAKEVEFSKLKSKAGVILDSGGSPGEIIVEAPGQTKVFAKVIGKAAHAGAHPENGVSAIMVAAEAVSEMKLLRVDQETTANIGTFKAEGPTNIVSPLVEIIAEARSRSTEKLNKQTENIVECLKKSCKKYGAELEYSIENTYYSYVIDPEDEHLKEVSATCESLGIPVENVLSGGGSDANIYNLNGIKALNIGVGIDLAHTIDERLNISDFVNASEVVLKLMTSTEK